MRCFVASVQCVSHPISREREREHISTSTHTLSMLLWCVFHLLLPMRRVLAAVSSLLRQHRQPCNCYLWMILKHTSHASNWVEVREGSGYQNKINNNTCPSQVTRTQSDVLELKKFCLIKSPSNAVKKKKPLKTLVYFKDQGSTLNGLIA